MTHDILNEEYFPIYVHKTIQELAAKRKLFKKEAEKCGVKLRRSVFDTLNESGVLQPFNIMDEIKRCVEGYSRLSARERSFIRGLILTAASKLIVANNLKARRDAK